MTIKSTTRNILFEGATSGLVGSIRKQLDKRTIIEVLKPIGRVPLYLDNQSKLFSDVYYTNHDGERVKVIGDWHDFRVSSINEDTLAIGYIGDDIQSHREQFTKEDIKKADIRASNGLFRETTFTWEESSHAPGRRK